jgi:hypothetical protein
MFISHFRFNKFAFFSISFPIILTHAILSRFRSGNLLRKACIVKICLYYCRNVLTCMAVGGMHGSERYAWQWKACMAVGGMHGNGRHAWQWKACMAVEGMHGSGRHAWQWKACMAVGGMHGNGRHAWQWEVEAECR